MKSRKVHLAEGHGKPAICGTNTRHPDKCYAVRGWMTLGEISESVSCKRCRRAVGLDAEGGVWVRRGP